MHMTSARQRESDDELTYDIGSENVQPDLIEDIYDNPKCDAYYPEYDDVGFLCCISILLLHWDDSVSFVALVINDDFSPMSYLLTCIRFPSLYFSCVFFFI